MLDRRGTALIMPSAVTAAMVRHANGNTPARPRGPDDPWPGALRSGSATPSGRDRQLEVPSRSDD